MELTIHDVPEQLGRALRAKASAEGKSVDQVAIEALAAAATLSSRASSAKLNDIAGTWVDDPIFDEVRREHDQIDPDLWK